MKIRLLLYCLLAVWLPVSAQDKDQLSETAEQQLENLAKSNQTAANDDSYLQQQATYKKHPLNMNTATAESLDELGVLTALQVQQFLLYRNLLGKLVSLYELQAVPSWDIGTIKRLLPFITVADDRNLSDQLKERWNGGDQVLLARYGRTIEKSKGYNQPADTAASRYLGSPDKIYLRYSYNYKNLLQWGFLGDKDAGEQFFRGHQQLGFDFYSFHLFARKLGFIKAIAIGDFTVNFGQGLTQWQSLAFRKSAAVLNIKRQSATLRPYNSAGEFNFHRGAGITLQRRKWETTLFVSAKKISANTFNDTTNGSEAVLALLAGGYHRTVSENDDRNSLQQTSAGVAIAYQANRAHLGANAVYYHFSKPVQKRAAGYNLFSLQGPSLGNASIDYGYTWRNMHVFGEAAVDDAWHTASLHGIIISPDQKADISFLYRNISRAYRSINTNAFTENTLPVNETGLYSGVSIRPSTHWQLDAYADMFRFPWLKYRVDAPSTGRDFLLQASYSPNKLVQVYLQYRNELKMINRSGSDSTTSLIDVVTKKDLRLQTSISLNRQTSLRNRVEMIWYNNKSLVTATQGFLIYTDLSYQPSRIRWKGNGRLQYFEAGDFNARLYAFEGGMPYNFSIPFYYDKGIRYYLNLNCNASKAIRKTINANCDLDFWLRWSQTIYPGKEVLGSGLDEIKGNHRTDIQFQLLLTW